MSLFSRLKAAAALATAVLAVIFGRRTATGRDPETRHAAEQLNPAVRYEHSDVSLKWLLISALMLVLAAVFIQVLVWGLVRVFSVKVGRRPPPPPIARTELPEAPGPRLTADLPRLLRELHAREDAKVQSYRWQNKEANVTAIPIERAMELLLQRGLPGAPAQLPQAPWAPQPPAEPAHSPAVTPLERVPEERLE